ncbi:MAG: hypothetical protein JNG89_09630, partial [Planctomycetaceae bacterium]|nr:hypothetical protein [Planctomycetaceae bacterium]
LHRDLAKRQVRLRIVEAHATARDLLRAAGVEERVGHIGRRLTIEQAIAESRYPSNAAATPAAAPLTPPTEMQRET